MTLGLFVAPSTSLALKAFFLAFLPRRRTSARLNSHAAQRRMRPAGAVRAASPGPALARSQRRRYYRPRADYNSRGELFVTLVGAS